MNLLCNLAINQAEQTAQADSTQLEKWLAHQENLLRLEQACEKILENSCSMPDYNPERAFSILAKRLNSVARGWDGL